MKKLPKSGLEKHPEKHSMKHPMKRSINGSTKRPRRVASRGGAAVEFALVLPLFLLLVMGALDYGYYFFSSQIVTGAAREGARAGTLVNPGAAGASGTATANATTMAVTYMNNNGVTCPGGAGVSSCITVTIPTVSGQQAVQVRIDYATVSLTGFTRVALPSRVQAQAVMLW